MNRRALRAELLRAIALILFVTLTWCINQNRLSRQNWRVPLFTQSDALGILAIEKSAAEGNFTLLFPKNNPWLGAPYDGNQNDYPITEDPIIVVGGLLTRVLGLFVASNLLVLVAFNLAALSFYFTARALHYRWSWAFLGAVLFAFSHFAFKRGLAHLLLTYYWHIPLCLLVCAWTASKRGLPMRRGRFWVACLVGLATGVQNPYYTNIFLQFLGFAALGQALRGYWRKALAPLLIGTVTVCGFLLMNVDTFYYQARYGVNVEAAGRSYQSVELYALKPLDLLLPPPNHRSAWARKIAWDYTYSETKKVLIQGEAFSPYLGIIGICGLVWLGCVAGFRAFRLSRRPIPAAALLVSWIVLYSVVGGVNGLLGQMGFNLFRCANRYSIYILAIVLLFLTGRLSRLSRSWNPLLSGGLIILLGTLGLWDQLPPRVERASLKQASAAISSDRAFTQRLEGLLPPGAMVFQVPAMRFPESWPINSMGDYEHFRLYLYSHSLRFSYGDDKGRHREDWQFEIERLPGPEMITELARLGFSALSINRKGFADRAAGLLKDISQDTNYTIVESRDHDLAAVVFQPAANPELPQQPPNFQTGWYGEEGGGSGETWHYSKGNAELVLYNDSPSPRRVRIDFALASPSPREVQVFHGKQLLYQSPRLTMERCKVSLVLDLETGPTTLSFKTDPPVTFSGSRDQRILGFLLYNLKVTPEEKGS